MPVVDGRQHITSALRGESLQRRSVLEGTRGKNRAVLDRSGLIHVGGCNFDRGMAPRLEEISRRLLAQIRAVVAVGAGERGRHAAAIAEGVGVPIGIISELVALSQEQNAEVLAALLGGRGIPVVREHVWDLGTLLAIRQIPIIQALPPYSLWETPGVLHDSNFGVERMAANWGIEKVWHWHAPHCDGDCT